MQVNEDGSFTYAPVAGVKGAEQGTKMYNRNGVKAIRRDRNGEIKNVLLTNEDGSKTYNLKGDEAQEAAYQILLKETQTPEGQQRVDEALSQSAEDARVLEEARTQPKQEAQEAPAEQTEAKPQKLSLGERMQGNEKLSDEARLVLSKYMIALSSISPNHKVIVHDTQAQVREEWLKAKGDPNGNH